MGRTAQHQTTNFFIPEYGTETKTESNLSVNL